MMRFILLLFLIFPLNLIAQFFPKDDYVFDSEAFPAIYININQNYLDSILKPGYENKNIEYPAQFIFKKNGESTSINNIGFRLRGNTSRYSAKKSFKVSFNTFSDTKFHDLEKLNLNGEHNDPTVCRSYIFWHLAEMAGIPGSRINHVNLYINNQFKGLYVNVEHIDEEFVELRYGNKNGNLYKCTYPADLNYISSNPNSYKISFNGTRVYELTTNEEIDDYSDLSTFIHTLTFFSGEELRKRMDTLFNVNAFLKYYAFEVLTGHWDGYAFNKNNFYLYHNTATGKFEFIPYDGDNTFGVDWFNIDWAKRDVNQWENDNRPLAKKLLAIPEYRNVFNFYLNEMLDQWMNPTILNPLIANLKTKISPSVQIDPFYPLDYGYSFADFEKSFDQATGAHIKYGLKNYIATRYTYARSQVKLKDIAPIISQLTHNQPGIRQLASVQVHIQDEDESLFPWVHYQKSPNEWDSIPMYNDGLHNDQQNKDSYYGALIQTHGLSDSIPFFIKIIDSKGNLSLAPYSTYDSIPLTNHYTALVINELMTNNSEDTVDENDQHEDWIELYNYGSGTISTSGLFLSDDPEDLMLWPLPVLNLAAGEFLLIWADKDENQGPTHASFKLSNRGESLFLSSWVDNQLLIIDQVEIPILNANQTFGRYPNGFGPFQILPESSPEKLNHTLSSKELLASKPLIISPNPFADFTLIRTTSSEGENKKLNIYNVKGQLILSQEDVLDEWIWNGKTASGNEIPAGIYLFEIINSNGDRFFGKALKQ